MIKLTVSLHACDRLAQRFGIMPADPETVAAALMQSPAIVAALSLGGTGKVTLPQIGAQLVLQGGTVVTAVVDISARDRGITGKAPSKARGRPQARSAWEHDE